MNQPSSHLHRNLLLVGLFLVAALGLGLWSLLTKANALPTGPVAIVWDREACAHCRMHVGEPGFAAQVQLQDGSVLNFDDPGCLLSWLDKDPPPLHAVYFHHQREDRWLSREQVGFVPAQHTPMGFGLGAVDKTSSAAIGLEAAQAQLRGRGHHHGGGS